MKQARFHTARTTGWFASYGSRSALLAAFLVAALVGGVVRLAWLQLAEGERWRKETQNRVLATEKVSGHRGAIRDRLGRHLASPKNVLRLEIVHPVPEENRDFIISFLSGVLQMDPTYVTTRFGFDGSWKERLVPRDKAVQRLAKRLPDASTDGIAVVARIPSMMKRASSLRQRVYYVPYDIPDAVTGPLSQILQFKPRTDKHGNIVGMTKEEARTLWLSQHLQGLRVQQRAGRFLPQGDVASQTVGLTAEPDSRFALRAGREPELTDVDGVSGVELAMDRFLRGHVGRRMRMLARKGITSFVAGPSASELAGNDVLLTIDSVVQGIAERALDDAVRDSVGRVGIAVVMDVKSGELLAVAQRPGFNPMARSLYDPDEMDRSAPLAFTARFDPGSTVKPLVLAMGLQEGIVTLDERVFCYGGYWIISKTSHETVKLEDHEASEWLTWVQVIARSSNIGIGQLGLRLGARTLMDYYTDLGFGRTTGVMQPFGPEISIRSLMSSVGLVPDLSDVELEQSGDRPRVTEVPGRIPNASEMTNVDTVNCAFGQGIAVTPIQLVAAMNTLANDGVWVRPVLIQELRDHQDRTTARPHRDGIRVFSPDVARQTRVAMQQVVSEEGTGSAAAVHGVAVGGKTGTAQKFKSVCVEAEEKDGSVRKLCDGRYVDEWSAWFVGSVPIDNPRFTILVMVDEPKDEHTGGDVSAPAFSTLARSVLSYYKIRGSDYLDQTEEADALPVPPAARKVDPAKEDANDTDVDSASVMVPDFTGMSVSRVVRTAADSGLAVKATGTGFAVSQVPAPRTVVPMGTPVSVQFDSQSPEVKRQ